MRNNLIRITYDVNYVETLKESGTRGKFKAMAFLSYIHDTELGEHYSSRYYADVWRMSSSTAWAWLKEFRTADDNAEMQHIR